jgi:hypothetical protein
MGQNGQTNRVPCAFGMFSTITAQPERQMRMSTCGAGPSLEESFPAGFAAAFRAGFAADFAVTCRAELRDRVPDKVRAGDFVALRLTALRPVRRVDRLVDLVAVI